MIKLKYSQKLTNLTVQWTRKYSLNNNNNNNIFFTLVVDTHGLL